MKNLIIILALTVSFMVYPQAKQDRVMLQQIAFLKTYGSYLKKGYTIARDGLSFVGRMKSGELGLHSLFFDGLQLVNPRLREYEKVYAIVTLNGHILEKNEAIEQQLHDDLLYTDEKAYIRRVFSRVTGQARDDLDALYGLLTDTAIVADDAQRIARIDALAEAMQLHYFFARGFSDAVATLTAARQKEQRDLRTSRQLYNVNPQP